MKDTTQIPPEQTAVAEKIIRNTLLHRGGEADRHVVLWNLGILGNVGLLTHTLKGMPDVRTVRCENPEGGTPRVFLQLVEPDASPA